MVNIGTKVMVVDNTGVLRARCIKVFGHQNKSKAKIGDAILVVVEGYTLKRGFFLDEKKKERFMRGKLHKALVLRTKFRYNRLNGTFINFNDNAVSLINKRLMPLSKRVKGPLLYEIFEKLPAIGILSRWLV